MVLVPRFGTRHMKDLMAYRGAILWNKVSFITSIKYLKQIVVSASTMRHKDENVKLLTFEH